MLRHVNTAWYLPRYDLSHALAIQRTLDSAERRHASRGFGTIPTMVSRGLLGLGRFSAAIGAGFLLTAFSPDIWNLLYRLADGHSWSTIVILAGCLGFLPFGFLAHGIHRRTGIRQVRITLSRALRIWLPGYLFSLLLAALLAWLVAPAYASPENPALRIGVDRSGDRLPHLVTSLSPASTGFDATRSDHFVVVLLYALIAVAFGIFGQLLFDDKPATAPLDAP